MILMVMLSRPIKKSVMPYMIFMYTIQTIRSLASLIELAMSQVLPIKILVNLIVVLLSKAERSLLAATEIIISGIIHIWSWANCS